MAHEEEDLSILIPQPPNPAEELAKIKAEGTSVASQAEAAADPKTLEVYNFEIEHKDPSGKIWAGKFTNQILSIQQRMQVGTLRARLLGNTPVSALDADTAYLGEVVAHLTVSLTKKPNWFQTGGLDAIRNTELLFTVYEEVAAHEATFRGALPPQGSSEAGS